MTTRTDLRLETFPDGWTVVSVWAESSTDQPFTALSSDEGKYQILSAPIRSEHLPQLLNILERHPFFRSEWSDPDKYLSKNPVARGKQLGVDRVGNWFRELVPLLGKRDPQLPKWPLPDLWDDKSETTIDGYPTTVYRMKDAPDPWTGPVPISTPLVDRVLP